MEFDNGHVPRTGVGLEDVCFDFWGDGWPKFSQYLQRNPRLLETPENNWFKHIILISIMRQTEDPLAGHCVYWSIWTHCVVSSSWSTRTSSLDFSPFIFEVISSITSLFRVLKRKKYMYTRVFFISINDFAWASQCLIFQPFEPQKMLIQCLEFSPTNTAFRLQIGKNVTFWQYGSFEENIGIRNSQKCPTSVKFMQKRTVGCQSLTLSASANA